MESEPLEKRTVSVCVENHHCSYLSFLTGLCIAEMSTLNDSFCRSSATCFKGCHSRGGVFVQLSSLLQEQAVDVLVG
uniref:Uncharacterized protein n=1 Tax=Chenopodium quinoa TaxID=63459 RepID=A0A803KTB8_CHEQI